MRLGYKALEGRWDEKAAKWRVKLENVNTREIFEDEGDVFISAIGSLNDWRWPQIPGIRDFQGKMLHSAAWDQQYDYKVIFTSSDCGMFPIPS